MPNLKSLNTAQACSNAVEMELKHPSTGEVLRDETSGEPWVLLLIGSDAPEYVQAQKRILNQQLSQMTGRRNNQLTADYLETQEIELLVVATRGWRNLCYENDQPFEYNAQNARRMYSEAAWIREQARDFISNRANFLGNSSKTS